MAQIVTITNPLTGQPVQVDQLEHTAQQIDDGVNAAGIKSADYPGCYYRMVGGVVEWLNPPMILGVEYRTTERHCGKPVYKQLFALGHLPSTAGKTEYYPFGESATSGSVNVFSADFYAASANDGYSGWKITLPEINPDGTILTAATFTGARIDWYLSEDRSSYYGFAYLKYTKPYES